MAKDKLNKSLGELDKAADELLAKSENNSSDENIDPKEIAQGATSDEEEQNGEEKQEENNEEGQEPEAPKEDEEGKGTEGEEDVQKSNCSSDIKKGDGEEPSKDDGEAEGQEPTEPDEEEQEGEDEATKSMKNDFETDKLIKSMMAESEFITSIVDILAKSMGRIDNRVERQGESYNEVSDVLAKSLNAVIASNKTLRTENDKLTRRINSLEKSMTEGFGKILDSLDEISTQPIMRKSVQSLQVQDKDFNQSIGVQSNRGFDSLSKAEVLNILSSELSKGNTDVTSMDIISYESGAPIRPELKMLIERNIK